MNKMPVGETENGARWIKIDPFKNIFIHGKSGLGKTNFINNFVDSMIESSLLADSELLFVDETRVNYTWLRQTDLKNVTVSIQADDAEATIKAEIEKRLNALNKYESIKAYNQFHYDKLKHFIIVADHLGEGRLNRKILNKVMLLGEALNISVIISSKYHIGVTDRGQYVPFTNIDTYVEFSSPDFRDLSKGHEDWLNTNSHFELLHHLLLP